MAESWSMQSGVSLPSQGRSTFTCTMRRPGATPPVLTAPDAVCFKMQLLRTRARVAQAPHRRLAQVGRPSRTPKADAQVGRPSRTPKSDAQVGRPKSDISRLERENIR